MDSSISFSLIESDMIYAAIAIAIKIKKIETAGEIISSITLLKEIAPPSIAAETKIESMIMLIPNIENNLFSAFNAVYSLIRTDL